MKRQKGKHVQIASDRVSAMKESGLDAEKPHESFGKQPQELCWIRQPLTIELWVGEKDMGPQPIMTIPKAGGEERMRNQQKILKPRVVAHPARSSAVQPAQGAASKKVTILFKVCNQHGKWEEIDASKPSDVERIAKKYAQNRQAIFHDKNGHMITPAQCCNAAVKNGTNTIFMTFKGESILQALNDNDNRSKHWCSEPRGLQP
ncbi:hypothetical protein CISG_10221 [Coccidioides immitis RMSCC 3703]|uniref:Uncharacterized protein n=1 Tax=Coccidioides immitis RMSCC 3703 TaxID=454286 RepID=A0A0J8QN34_COCIT|nr:hypothetical protein CISG_10221 [Coccidioides immitis RMSCC 3703]